MGKSSQSKKLIISMIIAIIGFISFAMPYANIGSESYSLMKYLERIGSSGFWFYFPFIIGLIVPLVQLIIKFIKPLNIITLVVYLYYMISTFMQIGAMDKLGMSAGAGTILGLIATILGLVFSIILLVSKNTSKEVN